jgi:hypothetical protein
VFDHRSSSRPQNTQISGEAPSLAPASSAASGCSAARLNARVSTTLQDDGRVVSLDVRHHLMKACDLIHEAHLACRMNHSKETDAPRPIRPDFPYCFGTSLDSPCESDPFDGSILMYGDAVRQRQQDPPLPGEDREERNGENAGRPSR